MGARGRGFCGAGVRAFGAVFGFVKFAPAKRICYNIVREYVTVAQPVRAGVS